MGIDYLRVSVTDRCNLRCVYCHSPSNQDLVERKEILRFEEIRRIVRLLVQCGIRKIRLTGGEPLVRKDIAALVRKLAQIPGVAELTLTTNGVLLEPMAAELKQAGLQRVNISLNSMERRCYTEMTGFDYLSRVIDGIHAAIRAGLVPVKINCVILRDVNESQISRLVQMGMHLPVWVRFIEYCPTSRYARPAACYVPNLEIRRIIERQFGPLSARVAGGADGPAHHFRIEGWAGAVGFISGRSSSFCHACNRLRLSSDGKIRPCLYSAHSYDVKRLLRGGADDPTLLDLMKEIFGEKNRYTKLNSPAEDFSMQTIGG